MTLQYPDASNYISRSLNEYLGTIIVFPPCTLAAKSFSLQSVRTLLERSHLKSVAILPTVNVSWPDNTDGENKRIFKYTRHRYSRFNIFSWKSLSCVRKLDGGRVWNHMS